MSIADILLKFTKDEYKNFDKAVIDSMEKERSNACLTLLTRIAASCRIKGILSAEDDKKIHDAAFGE